MKNTTNNPNNIYTDISKDTDKKDKSFDINPQFDDLQAPETFINHIHGLSEAFKGISGNGKSDLSEILQSLEVKATDELKPPEVAWEQITEKGTALLGTLGNFSLLIGKPKSKKTFCVSIAVSAVLQEDLLLNQFSGRLPKDKKKVLYFDTEQGKYHVQLVLHRICKQINIEVPEDLHVYHLRSQTPAERLDLIEHAINNTPNLGFVIIDGIKDLVTSINDEGEATMIASKLLKWTEEKDIHILTVLHQNKSDNNARGHIGTELINKAETVLSVTINEYDKEISIVEPQMCRNRPPEPFAFEINEEGLPIIVKDFVIRTESKKNKFDVQDLDVYQLQELLVNVYAKGESFTYTELRIQIQISYKELFKKTLADNRAKKIITLCKNNELLNQEKPKAPYTLDRLNLQEEVPF